MALLCALATTLCYGVSTVLQAIGARREAQSHGLDPALLARLVKQGPFMAGLALDVAAVGFTIVALRHLPLFAVQSAIAASVAVTAIVASRVFGSRLGRGEWFAIGGIGVGLVLLAFSAGPEVPPHVSVAGRLVLLGVVVAVAVVSVPAARLRGRQGAMVLGALSGVAYGTANTALRVIQSFNPTKLIVNPASYVALIGAAAGVLLIATALQRGSVTAATGALVVSETLLPSIYGAIVLGERPRPGWLPVALIGFVVTISAAVSLSRFGDVQEVPS